MKEITKKSKSHSLVPSLLGVLSYFVVCAKSEKEWVSLFSVTSRSIADRRLGSQVYRLRNTAVLIPIPEPLDPLTRLGLCTRTIGSGVPFDWPESNKGSNRIKRFRPSLLTTVHLFLSLTTVYYFLTTTHSRPQSSLSLLAGWACARGTSGSGDT